MDALGARRPFDTGAMMHPITALNLIHRAQLQLAFCRRQLGILRAARDAARASTWRWRLAAAVLALA